MSENNFAIHPIEGSGERHSEILKTLIDISRIITDSHNLSETLENTVERVARSLNVDVCSIYIHDPGTGLLELKATHGLSKNAVGIVRMPVNEGLIGYVFEEKHHINLNDVTHHPRFKFFPKIDEERLSSFLGVPLIEYRKTLGVLVVQNQENRLFSKEEENLLITIASQISGLVSKALLVTRLQQEATQSPPPEAPSDSYQIQGVPIAPGLAKGKVVVLQRPRIEEPEHGTPRTPKDERAALQQAIDESEQEIIALISEVTRRVNEQEAAIFHSHLLFLEDRGFMERIHTHIDQGASAAWAVSTVVKEFLAAFHAIDDPYLKERGADLQDVGIRLLKHLGLDNTLRHTQEISGILLAEMLLPSDTVNLDPRRIKGIITAVGGHVSHAAILARSLRIPAVSGIEKLLTLVGQDVEVLVDGGSGTVFVNPGEGLTKEFERYQNSRAEYLTHLADLRDVPCLTRCGHPLRLRGNVSMAQDLAECQEFGSEGIGLYRTEAFYLMRTTPPTVAELTETYAKAMEVADGHPVIFRTLDLGGERPPTYLNFPEEDNPSLGSRSIRYQLQHPNLLKDQITATLEVAHLGEARIAFPMISQFSELQEVKRIFRQCRGEFEKRNGRSAPELKFGMVFEVPSTILMCEMFLEELDFACIGSNDLTQYVLAVDRNNPHVSHLYDPLEPAVLIMIKRLLDAAAKMGKPVELTGELASDPEGCLILVGLGLRDLSMNSPLIPIMKDHFSKYTLREMEQLAEIALKSTSAANVRRNIQLFHHG